MGREEDGQRLNAAMEAHAWVTVIGPPGVGKSSLARVQVGVSERPFGWVDLAGVHDLTGITTRMGSALDRDLSGDPARIAAVLASTELVLVFDNAEPVAATLALILQQAVAAGARDLLVTSRIALGGPGEHLLTLGPLDPAAACAMLSAHVARLAPALPLAEDDAFEALVDALDRLPLTLELVAPRLVVQTAAQVLAGLFSTHDAGALGLHAAISSSWERLSPLARRTLSALSRFRAPVPAQALSTVLGFDAVPPLLELVRESLVSVESRFSDRWVRTFDAVGAFARRAPEPASETEGRARWVTSELRACAQGVARDGGASSLRRARVRFVDLEAVLVWLRQEQPDRAAEVLLDCFAIIERILPYDRLHALSMEVAAATRGDLAARLGVAGAGVRVWMGDVEAARAELAAAAPGLEDPGERAWARLLDARMLELSGRLDEACAAADVVMADPGILPPARQAHAHRIHGGILRSAGQLERALATLNAAVDLARTTGSIWEEGMIRCELASLLGIRDLHGAEAHLTAALAADARLGGDLAYRERVLCNLAILRAECAPDRAPAVMDESILLARRGGRSLVVAYLRALDAVAALLRGDPRAVVEARLVDSIEETAVVGPGYAHRNAQVTWSALPLLHGEPAPALARARGALERADASARPWLEAVVGLAQAQAGHPPQGPVVAPEDAALALVWARIAGARGDDASAAVSAATERLAPWPDQLSAVLLRASACLEAGSPARLLEVEPGGAWFAVDGHRVELGRRDAARRVLRALVDAHPSARVCEPEELFAAGWPETRISPLSARQRVYTTVRDLRRIGLEGLLQTSGPGYRLDPALEITLGGA